MSSIKTVVYSLLILALLAICCNARATYQHQEDTDLFSERENNFRELLEPLFKKRANCVPYGAPCGGSNGNCCAASGNNNGCLSTGYCYCNPLGGVCSSNGDCCGNGGTYNAGPQGVVPGEGGNYIGCHGGYCGVNPAVVTKQ